MRNSEVQASLAQASEAAKTHLTAAAGAIQQHWLPLTAAATGLYCLWKLIKFLRLLWISPFSL